MRVGLIGIQRTLCSSRVDRLHFRKNLHEPRRVLRISTSSLQVCWTQCHAPAAPRGLRSAGVFVSWVMREKPRVGFFVDGFNLYHSVAQVADEAGDASVKWLDLNGMLAGILPLIRPAAEMATWHYFTALPEHLYLKDPSRLQRYRTYIRALTAQSTIRPCITYGRIARQQVMVQCMGQNLKANIWREKGTDVALAMALLVEASHGCMDEAVILSGDTDYLPAVRAFREMFPGIGLRFAFPRGRASKELLREAPASFTLAASSYWSHRLPDSIKLPSGKTIYCPAEWRRPSKVEEARQALYVKTQCV